MYITCGYFSLVPRLLLWVEPVTLFVNVPNPCDILGFHCKCLSYKYVIVARFCVYAGTYRVLAVCMSVLSNMNRKHVWATCVYLHVCGYKRSFRRSICYNCFYFSTRSINYTWSIRMWHCKNCEETHNRVCEDITVAVTTLDLKLQT